jgi:Ser/Thr protein kinase RdoA (MazF antagonist)
MSEPRASSGSSGLASELTQRISSAFELVDPKISPISGGLLHRSYFLRAEGKEYILQRVNPVFSPRIHDNIEAVTQHLRARGVQTFRLVTASDGRLYSNQGDEGSWRLLTRVPGVSFGVCEDVEQARSAGALVARFHSALSDYEGELHSLGFAFHDTPRHLSALASSLEAHAEHRHRAAVAELASEIFTAVSAWESLDDLPRRVIHGDLKFSNVLFAGEGGRGRVEATCLIDLDTLSRLPVFVDLGDAWRSWCNVRAESEVEARLDLALFRASVEGYAGVPGVELERRELATLAQGLDRISLELCARFAADTLEESYFDWSRERYESAGDHNLARARGQLSLYRQARDTLEERTRFLTG